MTDRSERYDTMDLDDFEDLLPDMPHDEKWELIEGRVVKMMVGARWEHHYIVHNLTVGLSNRLRERNAGCRVFAETFFMKSKALESATLPDIIVRCGPMLPGATSIDDPIVLVEVMSVGTAGRDRGEKWRVYRKLPSLQHYVLVDRDEPRVEVFDRQGEAWASLRTLEDLDAVLDLPALAVSMPLADIYADVLSA